MNIREQTSVCPQLQERPFMEVVRLDGAFFPPLLINKMFHLRRKDSCTCLVMEDSQDHELVIKNIEFYF